MNRRRAAVAISGFLALALAVATRRAGSGGVGPVRPLVEVVGNDYVLVAGVAAVALAVAVGVAVSARAANLHQMSMPEPERPVSAPAPGTDFDDMVRSPMTVVPVVGRSQRTAVRDRLRTTAVETIERARGCDATEAERAVATGAWTDDPWAAAFVGETVHISPSTWLSAVAGAEVPFTLGATRTANAIADAADVDLRTDAKERTGDAGVEGTDDGSSRSDRPADDRQTGASTVEGSGNEAPNRTGPLDDGDRQTDGDASGNGGNRPPWWSR